MATYYVAPNGGDGTTVNGDSAHPWKTLTNARNRAGSDDTIIVRDGTYDLTGPVKPKTGQQWYSETQYGAKLNCSNTNVTKAFSLERTGATDVTIDGFEIYGSKGSGIGANETVNLRVTNCLIYNCVDNGIGANNSDLIWIEGNHVHHCATMGARSGISILTPKVVAGRATPSDGYRIHIMRNITHHNGRTTESGKSDADGNGIILDKLHWDINVTGGTPFTGRTLVEGNLSYFNGGCGLKLMSSTDCRVQYNTFWSNRRNQNKDGNWNSGIESMYSWGNEYYYNISVATETNEHGFGNHYQPNSYASNPDRRPMGPQNRNDWLGNIFYATGTNGQAVNREKSELQLPTASQYINADPLLKNPKENGGDFSLAAGSPGLGVAPGGKNIGYWQGGTPPGPVSVTVKTPPTVTFVGTKAVSGGTYTWAAGTYNGTPTTLVTKAQVKINGQWQAVDTTISPIGTFPTVTEATTFAIKDDVTGPGITGTLVNRSATVTVYPPDDPVDPGVTLEELAENVEELQAADDLIRNRLALLETSGSNKEERLIAAEEQIARFADDLSGILTTLSDMSPQFSELSERVKAMTATGTFRLMRKE